MKVEFALYRTFFASTLKEVRETWPGAVIHAIDDRAVIALCEACGEPIFEPEQGDHPTHVSDSDGYTFHAKCWDPAEEDQ